MARWLAVLVALGAVWAADSYGDDLDIVVYPDGMAHVSASFEADPLDPVFEVGLLGTAVDNFVATGEGGKLLSAEFRGDVVVLDTFDSATVTVDYDIHDLVSKEGRIWTFTLDSARDYSLLMPSDAVIVGMDAIPTDLRRVDGKTYLKIPGGSWEISYVLSYASPGTASPPPADGGEIPLALLIAAAGAAGAFVVMRFRAQQRRRPVAEEPAMREPTVGEPVVGEPTVGEPEEVLAKMPAMREDDREIVRYILESGGETSESSLRKKFLQPKTTMWRAVRRLERMGVVEITKRDTQNLVRMRDDPGCAP